MRSQKNPSREYRLAAVARAIGAQSGIDQLINLSGGSFTRSTLLRDLEDLEKRGVIEWLDEETVRSKQLDLFR